MQLAVNFGSRQGAIRAWPLECGAHGYAEIYDSVFAPWRADSFALLEIGLHTPSTHGGTPTDAPSLRLCGEYFPRARLYGFDIKDFRHVSLPRARILRGDQGSPVDIAACNACWLMILLQSLSMMDPTDRLTSRAILPPCSRISSRAGCM
jgi:hypothetical protein